MRVTHRTFKYLQLIVYNICIFILITLFYFIYIFIKNACTFMQTYSAIMQSYLYCKYLFEFVCCLSISYLKIPII